MHFQQRQYLLLAKAMRLAMIENQDEQGKIVVETVIRCLADSLAEENRSFNKELFFQNCGLNNQP